MRICLYSCLIGKSIWRHFILLSPSTLRRREDNCAELFKICICQLFCWNFSPATFYSILKIKELIGDDNRASFQVHNVLRCICRYSNSPLPLGKTTYKISNYLTRITTGNVTTNPSGSAMTNWFSLGCVIHVTMSIPVSKVSASRLSDAHSSALIRAAGLECDIIANVTAIALPATQTVVTHIPLSWHGCHRHGRNQQNNRQDGRNLHPVSINQTIS